MFPGLRAPTLARPFFGRGESFTAQQTLRLTLNTHTHTHTHAHTHTHTHTSLPHPRLSLFHGLTGRPCSSHLKSQAFVVRWPLGLDSPEDWPGWTSRMAHSHAWRPGRAAGWELWLECPHWPPLWPGLLTAWQPGPTRERPGCPDRSRRTSRPGLGSPDASSPPHRVHRPSHVDRPRFKGLGK